MIFGDNFCWKIEANIFLFFFGRGLLYISRIYDLYRIIGRDFFYCVFWTMKQWIIFWPEQICKIHVKISNILFLEICFFFTNNEIGRQWCVVKYVYKDWEINYSHPIFLFQKVAPLFLSTAILAKYANEEKTMFSLDSGWKVLLKSEKK